MKTIRSNKRRDRDYAKSLINVATSLARRLFFDPVLRRQPSLDFTEWICCPVGAGYVEIESGGRTGESDEAFPLQMQDDFLGRLLRRQLRCVHPHFGVSRHLVGIRYSGKFLQDPGTSFRVEALSIALLTNFYRRGEVHKNEGAEWLNQFADVLARRVIRRYRRADSNAAVFRDLGGDIANAA